MKLDLAFDIVVDDRTLGKVELMLNEEEIGVSPEEYRAMDEDQKENFCVELMHTAFESKVGCILKKAHVVLTPEEAKL